MVRAFRPVSFADALSIRKNEDVVPFAGGTDLMAQCSGRPGASSHFDKPVLFLGHLDELRFIQETPHEVIVGAATTLTDLIRDHRTPLPLKQAAVAMASPAIRNAATVGGNICNASPCGDTLPYLYSINAVLILQSGNSRREMPITEFIRGPGESDLNNNELLREIVIPRVEFNKTFYRKVGTRKANALSKLSFLGLAKTHRDRIEDIRIAFGSVAPTVVRSEEIEESLIGLDKRTLKKMIPEMVQMTAPLIRPIDDQRSSARYRKTVSLNLLTHFLKEVVL